MKTKGFLPGLLTILITLILCFSVSTNALVGKSQTPPLAPTASNITASSAKISWSWGGWNSSFVLYRDGVRIGYFYLPSFTYTDTDLSPDTTYSYTVTHLDSSKDNNTWSDPSPACIVKTLQVIPVTPSAPTASIIGLHSATLNWDTVEGATTYFLYRNGAEVYKGSATIYTNNNLTADTTYSYTLKAGNTAGISPASPVLSFKTLKVPAAPTASDITANSVKISWDSYYNVESYSLYRDGARIYFGKATSYTDTGLSTNAIYSYTLELTNPSDKRFGPSPACKVTLGAIPTTPAAPTASNITNSSAILSWVPVPDATTYYLYRNGMLVYSGSETIYPDTGLSSNTPYSYTLKAGNALGTSPDSPVRSVTTLLAIPATPTASDITSTSVMLNWSVVSGATLYYLYRDGVQVYGDSGTSYTDTELSSSKTYSYTLRAYNINGYSLYSPACSVTTPSNDAKLKSFNINPGMLNEDFDPDKFDYTASVSFEVTSITISAEIRGQKAKIDGIGEKNLELGANNFCVEVTAEDGITKEIYEIMITRLSNDAKLKSLIISTDDEIVQLTPSFNPDETSYTASVPYEVSNVTIVATANHPKAEFTGAGLKSLEVGANTFAIEVIAEDGTTKTYIITINRPPPSSDASLSNLSISPGTLDTDFQAGITSYTVSVPYETEEIIITAEANHPAAKIDGDGRQDLEVGDNLFNITVTAQDKTTKTYTIVVTREPQPQLINLILSAGELDPGFDPDITSYIVSVAGEINTISITALVGGSGINIGFNQGGSHQVGNQWFSDSFSLDTAEKIIRVYVYKDGLLQTSYNITIMSDPPPKPIYKWEATGDIGTIGRVLFDIPDDKNFLDKYALVCDGEKDVEIYFSPVRTENAISAGQNTYVFAVRLPNGETDVDISFSFKLIGGSVEKNQSIIYGDINDDGVVTTTDATLVTRWAGGNVSTVLRNVLAADVNGDASITTTDATLITRRAGGNTATAFSIETRF